MHVGAINLYASWNGGRNSANKILVEFFGTNTNYNFSETCSKPQTDLFRPTGGAYVGSKSSPDDARSEEENPVATTIVPTSDGASISTQSEPQVGTCSKDMRSYPSSISFTFHYLAFVSHDSFPYLSVVVM